MIIKTAIITGFGINAEREMEKAFSLAEAAAEKVHIQDFMDSPALIHNYHILALPDGASFGNHLGAGFVFARMLEKSLRAELEKFVASGKLIIGISNGFQILAKLGLLPNLSGSCSPEVALIHNDTGVFENSWLKVSFNKESRCVWTKGLDEMDLPIRHEEGCFIAVSDAVLERIENDKLVAVRYLTRNPNGSVNNIAGITDTTGRVFGLMPHPEVFIFPENHPKWSSEQILEAEGIKIFRNGVNYIKENFS
ncbi:MAG: phosphoribosylformylglycinamidine synthase subunit PurQ [Spirochaetes bacterium]|nr:phosphoribosylformylglycinamidine synthase subunit PurQ [Spirochaetota bacterium]